MSLFDKALHTLKPDKEISAIELAESLDCSVGYARQILRDLWKGGYFVTRIEGQPPKTPHKFKSNQLEIPGV